MYILGGKVSLSQCRPCRRASVSVPIEGRGPHLSPLTFGSRARPRGGCGKLHPAVALAHCDSGGKGPQPRPLLCQVASLGVPFSQHTRRSEARSHSRQSIGCCSAGLRGRWLLLQCVAVSHPGFTLVTLPQRKSWESAVRTRYVANVIPSAPLLLCRGRNECRPGAAFACGFNV